ncbi:hypothetical protein KSF_087850 [Reticulibacter mediterranei]|uniref:WD40 repeat domain-containing protein n=1 Tax=Reticulibacter mediterranei TaxID=2778369 RepID=A0A8J3N4Z0_9CHLR|nr:WD40 repeat domain-containing protein [Reticulibacter mediterranei]GHO98737.1 hypothetical protein KSF_087850 [Reticulibacter mediterranei]
MLFYLHPTCHEALTLVHSHAGGSHRLTRWSLATTPATPLFQRFISWGECSYRANGQLFVASAGLSAPLDDGTFALVHIDPRDYLDEPILELCQWHDFSTVRTITFPTKFCAVCNPACSPDGCWLVANTAEHLILFDRLSGEVMSSCRAADYRGSGDSISALAFDAASRFVAGIIMFEGGGALSLWQLDPGEHPCPPPEESDATLPDQFRRTVTLSMLHRDLDQGDSPIPSDLTGYVAFSPDSRIVVFHLALEKNALLMAYEVVSGKRLWSAYQETSYLYPFVFAPGGKSLIAIDEKNKLRLYCCEDGSVLDQVSTGLVQPIEALAFNHDGTALWLATRETLVRYQLPVALTFFF